MNKPLRVLIIEDSEDDAFIFLRQLTKGGYEAVSERVDTRKAMITALDKQRWDVIISDYYMPHFSGLDALGLLKETGLDVPFIIVSGAIGEDIAVEAMKLGANDYVMKKNLARLVLSIERELREAAGRRERRRMEEERTNLIQELTDALAKIKTLNGLLPICASCKNIRDDQGYWQKVESFIEAHTQAEFTHGICPDCRQKLYPEYAFKT
jgi:DNA-binding NtrC family response regulator